MGIAKFLDAVARFSLVFPHMLPYTFLASVDLSLFNHHHSYNGASFNERDINGEANAVAVVVR
jgi:hypothetical protein